MKEDRFDRVFARALRILCVILGSGGFAFEVLSPSRTLWVGLLSVGLIGGQIANIVELMSKGGITIGISGKRKQEGAVHEHELPGPDDLP